MLWHSAAVTTYSLCCETLALLKSVNDMTRRLSSCRPPRPNGPNIAPRGSTGSTKNSFVQTFYNVDMVIREYARVTRHNLNLLGHEPQISDFYTPSSDQKKSEVEFIVAGMAATGLVAYKLTKWSELTVPDSTHSVSYLPYGRHNLSSEVGLNFSPEIFLQHRYNDTTCHDGIAGRALLCNAGGRISMLSRSLTSPAPTRRLSLWLARAHQRSPMSCLASTDGGLWSGPSFFRLTPGASSWAG